VAGSSSARRFTKVRPLGEGGMGSVWLAWDNLLQRSVAVKQMRVGYGNGVSPSRVLREARALSRLSHPNIVGVLELVEHDEGPWIVMEYVEGDSLADWITEPERPALAEDRVAEIGLTVLEALTVAHAAGVVHRDVKPANILIRKAPAAGPLSSRICLVDFGNAAIEGYELTTKSGLIGTPGFIAPERFRGITGPESDLWSLGVTLYEAVERRLPFHRDTPEQVMHAILEQDPDSTERARRLAPVLSRLLEKDPARRPDPRRAETMLRQVIAGHRADRVKDGRESTGGADPVRRTDSGLRSPDSVPSSPSSGFASIVALNPGEAAAVLRRQGPRPAALILARMATEHPSEAVAVLEAMTDGFGAELLRHAEPTAAVTLLLELPTEGAARLLTQLPQPAATEVVAALPVRDPVTVRLMRALPSAAAARLLNDTADEHAVALMELYGRRRTVAVLARMTPRRAARVLDRTPSDLAEAAAVLRDLPRERVGGILDRMDADRVAAILLADRAEAPRLLRSMRPTEAHEVIERMQRG
jgi:serine/threonine protein kinase